MAAHVAVVEAGVLPIGQDELFEQIADRLMVRRSEKKPTSEAWHRDEAKFAKPGDTLYGGWLNMDSTRVQYFSMVPGSANEVQEQNFGFSPIPKEDHVRLVSLSRRVAIPPGHLLIFNERTIHEVVAEGPTMREKKFGEGGSHLARCRLFFGWRTTKQAEPLTSNLMARLRDQEGLPLKSGQHLHPPPLLDRWTSTRVLLQCTLGCTL